MTKIVALAGVVSVLLLVGCATQATLTVHSRPEGAYISEKGTSSLAGFAPLTIYYNAASLRAHQEPDGCYLVRGFDAHWVSGATAALATVRLCGSAHGGYQITFTRDPSQAGFGEDMQFALKLQALRAQRQQAQAAEDAADAALFQAFSQSQSNQVYCTTRQIGSVVYTDCN